ncbi:MAG: DNA replication and repair protein RecF [bacterium]|nr:DNA replication and repair protein RecF [bacterium]
MFLTHLSLQNFRSYTKSSFDFTDNTTVIIGPNTAGKSNLMEAIFLLASGKSFRAEKKEMMIKFGKEMARVKGKIVSSSKPSPSEGEGGGEGATLEVMLTTGQVQGIKTPLTRYLVNDVPKRRVDFAGILSAVLFAPSDLEIIIDGPSLRREFLNQVLEQVSLEYRQAFVQYEKGLRQRNALLEIIRETGNPSQYRSGQGEQQLDYWSELLIRNGQILTKKRDEFLSFANDAKKELFQFRVEYDRSEISEKRLEQYAREEVAAASTLVGPHRDDFQVLMNSSSSPSPSRERAQGEGADIRFFGSRGQQRLAILQLKLMQIDYIEKMRGERPLLLLDDIFSELDEGHIQHVLGIVDKQQTVLTTTHREFLSQRSLRDMAVVELGESSKERSA